MERGAIIKRHRDFIGGFSPFLEIGANAGHTSYLLANEFSSDGFALDISADALRHGISLMDRWGLSRAPVRMAGDAFRLPFRDNSLRFVMTFQTLSQFLNLDGVFAEVKSVLAPGGVFLFAEEPMKRLLSLRLYRAPYYNLMRPWERKLYPVGAAGLPGARCDRRVSGGKLRHPPEPYDVPGGLEKTGGKTFSGSPSTRRRCRSRGWGERVVKRLAIRLDPHRSAWHAARWLGGMLVAARQKARQHAATAGNRAFRGVAALSGLRRRHDA